jgi:membrane fusion protein (multidrug efflux system)
LAALAIGWRRAKMIGVNEIACLAYPALRATRKSSGAEFSSTTRNQLRMQEETVMRHTMGLALLVCGWVSGVNAQEPQPAVVPVGTVVASRRPIAETGDFVGRIEAINRVEVNARVTGYLEAVLFREGDAVKEGDRLYSIEKGLFQAAVEQAQGELEKSQAAKVLTAIQLQRAEDLATKQAGTLVARDQALSADKQAEGAIMIDQANLQTAQINLGYTDIVSPIAGKIGKTNITKGNVVSPGSGVLTTIVSQDPMYVTFPVSQREFLRAQERGRNVDIKSIKVRLRFADGRTYEQLGVIDFVNVTVDRSTDTVLVRAIVPNPAGALIDGQLVRVNLESGKPEEKVVVPQAALIADQGGVYLFVVEEGKAAVRRVKPGAESGSDIVIDQGLSGGEQVIVDGLQNVRAGVPVRATPIPQTLGRS